MNTIVIDVAACRRSIAVLVGLMSVSIVTGGCLSTWSFKKNDKVIQIVNAGPYSELYGLEERLQPGDTVTFANHAGKDVVLEFPNGTVTARDEDPSTTNIIEVKVKRGRKKAVTITQNPPLINGVFTVYVADPGHGGADMIIQPPH